MFVIVPTVTAFAVVEPAVVTASNVGVAGAEGALKVNCVSLFLVIVKPPLPVNVISSSVPVDGSNLKPVPVGVVVKSYVVLLSGISDIASATKAVVATKVESFPIVAVVAVVVLAIVPFKLALTFVAYILAIGSPTVPIEAAAELVVRDVITILPVIVPPPNCKYLPSKSTVGLV